MMLAKLTLTALASLAIGAGGTYATVHVTAVCTVPAQHIAQDDGKLKAFLAPKPLPMNDQPEY